MNAFGIHEFTLRYNLAAGDVATWIYAFLTVLLLFFGVGLLWGRAWNREWSITGQVGAALLTCFFAVIAGYSVLQLRGVSKIENWMEIQRALMLNSSGNINRPVLNDAWKELVRNGSDQQGLVSPSKNAKGEIRLNTPEDAMVVARLAAQKERLKLRKKMPFSLGAPLPQKTPGEIAQNTVDAIPFDNYPTVKSSDNEWTTTAATMQINHSFDTATAAIKPGLDDLHTAALWLLIASVGIPLLLIPWLAMNDIKTNPRK